MTSQSTGSEVTRLRLEVAYDGTGFSGWARQPGLRTVQETLEAAVATVFRLPAVAVTVAGRTDAGVHARGQVCHVDVPTSALSAVGDVARRLSRLLRDDVVVGSAYPVDPDFDARFAATWRRYVYRICDEPQRADPLTRIFVLPWPHRLDESLMNAGAANLLGEHDFAAFCRQRERATTVRHLQHLRWGRDQARLELTVIADAFCQTMVRSLAGCLVSVGEGRRPIDWPADVLARRVRESAVRVMPAAGLTLEQVGYPPPEDYAERVAQARRMRSADE